MEKAEFGRARFSTHSTWTSLPDSFKFVTLMKRGICWIEKARDELNNAFWREAYNRIDTPLVRNQLMMPIWFSKEPAWRKLKRVEYVKLEISCPQMETI